MTEETGSEVHRYLAINSNLSIIKKENHLSLKTIKTKTKHFLPDCDLVTVKKMAHLEPWPRKEKGERKNSLWYETDIWKTSETSLLM